MPSGRSVCWRGWSRCWCSSTASQSSRVCLVEAFATSPAGLSARARDLQELVPLVDAGRAELGGVGQSLLCHPDLFPTQTHCAAERDLGVLADPHPGTLCGRKQSDQGTSSR